MDHEIANLKLISICGPEGEYVAYDPTYGSVYDIVEQSLIDVNGDEVVDANDWSFKPYEAFETSADQVSDGIWSWAPSAGETAYESDISQIVWSDGGSGDLSPWKVHSLFMSMKLESF